MVDYDLYRLSVSQDPCLEGVFRHQITSLLFYHDGFIVNGCRFTCQTMPPFMMCNLLAFTSPTWLQRFRFKLNTKQKLLDCLFALHFNGFHTRTEAIFHLFGQIFVCNSLARLRAGEPLKGQHFHVLQ